MNQVIRVVAILLTSLVPGFATDALNFAGHGYSMIVIVGGEGTLQITDVHLSIPGVDQATTIKASEFKIRQIEYKGQKLVLEFRSASPSKQKPSFKLQVKGSRGVLTINGKSILGEFDWLH